MKRIFISIPYTSDLEGIINYRVRKASKYFLHLLSNGQCPISPVVVGHPLVETYGVDNSLIYWNDYCKSELSTCDEVHVLTLDGWDKSEGVKMEIDKALELGIEVVYIPV